VSAAREREMAVYFLVVLVVFLVIYLFYAVTHPERF
jgi:K+-transporting ATPase KdpF subunit